ncbi:chitin deacetylase 8-like [Vanessa atalanta]|uniref:chitin deacetylase 8-like n=1 Tax=Vanessa atalanta TaxID=42275 RepID=UPI001FCD3DC8|nr:chitin deacetylase 8-like [Vanessa atalanta]
MKFASVALFLALIAFAFARELQLAEPCDEDICKLPMCRCSSVNIPGGLAPRDTPQFVTLTFDDAVTVSNIATYRSLLYNRKNKNNCPIGTTFFVSHEYTDYTIVNELYNRGFEIALHSISHKADQEYWRDASYERLMREIGDQKRQVAHFANIPINSIHGLRSPFLQMSGNTTYQMMASAGLTYDLSWPTIKYTNPGLWPYTLHYQSIQDCIIPPCPTASLPGTWIIPMISWSDLEGVPCSMVDTCYYNPGPDNEEGWFNLILKNFERHYLNNRAPFGFFIHEWYVRINPGLRRALTRFLDMINNLNDVFMVNANEVINWVQNPISVDQYAKRQCKSLTPSRCRQTNCNGITGNHTEKVYYMRVCRNCPRVYPWLNNPLGQ